ncbi:MAG: hypothetical protein M0019_04945 [Actinomycetota bacterium]|nr:hypothetical protein [Actinomycetota bacterium]
MTSIISRMIYGLAGLLAGIGIYMYVRTTATFETFIRFVRNFFANEKSDKPKK